MMIERTCGLLLLAWSLTGAPAWGVDEPQTPAPTSKPAAPSSLDDELLKELGDLPKPSKPGDKPAAGGKRPTDSLDEELLRGLGEKNAGAGSDDPVQQLISRMREAERLIKEAERGSETREKQESIVQALEKLLKQARQQQQQQQNSSQSQSQQPGVAQRQPGPQQPQAGPPQGGDQPARDSSSELQQRQTSQVDMAKMQDVLKNVWGQLPPRLREQMLQSGVEKFLPKYELLIEEYFKTLAQQQSEGR